MLSLALWPTAAFAALTRPLNAVSFSDLTHGYIVGAPNNVDGVLSWTTNGGASWHAKAVPNRYMVGVSALYHGTAVTAIAGEPFNGVYKSSDSGINWTTEEPIFGQSTALAGMAYLSGGRRVVIGKLHPSNQLAVIASSVTPGTWTTDFVGPYHPAPDASSDPPPTQAVLAAVDAVPSGAFAWAVGEDMTITGNNPPFDALVYKTADGGSTWTTQTVPSTTPGMTCVSAVDGQHAFIGQASKTLLRTIDGSTWTALPSLPATTGITVVNAIDAFDANHVMVVGNNGRIAWTSNAGSAAPAWTAYTSSTAVTLLGAQMLDETHWIAVGDNETILRTADAGAHWAGQTSATAPSATITNPPSGHLLDSVNISLEGTSSDGAGIGIAKVEVRVQRADGKYWNGSAWMDSSDTWITADAVDPAQGLDFWHKTITLPTVAEAGGSLTVWARATDGLGLQGTSQSIGALASSAIVLDQGSMTIGYNRSATFTGTLTSAGLPVGSALVTIKSTSSSYASSIQTDANGRFAFTVAPTSKLTYNIAFAGDAQHKPSNTVQISVLPQLKLGAPVIPKSVKHTKYAKFYSDLSLKHASGGRITFIFQRYQKIRGHYTWVTKKTVSAKVVTYKSWSRGTVSAKLTPAGKWRVQTKHADADHATSLSSQRGFTVR